MKPISRHGTKKKLSKKPMPLRQLINARKESGGRRVCEEEGEGLELEEEPHLTGHVDFLKGMVYEWCAVFLTTVQEGN